ncbi:NAD-dependent epimerase/dehydratase family protein [Candidatus Woesearchaeota archaeon]|nr:NAD-dependent epimerase/dehydratase family protein [Candidatus Woesearchaeota archaeon]
MKCLVTGGSGFIGSNLALELEKNGHEVTIADNLLTGNKKNLNGFNGKFIELDVSKQFDLNENGLNERFDAIFHEAAITDPRYPNDKETYNKNVQGFYNIIKFAQKNNAKLIYASTASLYGNGNVPMKENQKKELLSSYAKSKLEMDKIASQLFRKMHIVGLRYFNVFGPREKYKGRAASMVYHLARQIKDEKNPRIFKFGEQKRDHIYVKDVIDATIKALHAKKSCIVNVGTGIATTFNDLVKALNKELGKNLEMEYVDMPYEPKTYQNNTQAHTSKAEQLLGFKSKYSLKDGIKDYISWLNSVRWYDE